MAGEELIEQPKHIPQPETIPIAIASIPGEILCELLRRLDVKSLLGYRSVCKHWLSLIDDPAFVQSHHSGSEARHGGVRLFLADDDPELRRGNYFSVEEGGHATQLNPLTLLPGGDDTHYLGRLRPTNSANGLLCLYDEEENVYLCNPSTRHILLLPPPPPLTSKGTVIQTVCALGYDPCLKIYKVVRICRFSGNRGKMKEFQVLTLGPSPTPAGTRSWLTLNSVPAKIHWVSSPVFVNGAIHYQGRLGSDDEEEEVILAFQVREEKWDVFPMPEGVPSKSLMLEINGRKLGVRGGNVLADWRVQGEGEGEGEDPVDDVWVLEDYENKVWKRKRIQVTENLCFRNSGGYTKSRVITESEIPALNSEREAAVQDFFPNLIADNGFFAGYMENIISLRNFII